MKKLTIEVPDEIHRSLKIEAAEKGISIKEIIISCLEGRKKPKKK